jgi:hypothetical protein
MKIQQSQVFLESRILSLDYIKNPIKGLRRISRTQAKIIDCILYMEAKYGHAWPSQEFIGERVGAHAKYVNKCIKALCREGILQKHFIQNRPCVYKVSDFFKTNHCITLLKDWLPSLKYFYVVVPLCISLLMSASVDNISVSNDYPMNSPSTELLRIHTTCKLSRGFTIQSSSLESTRDSKYTLRAPAWRENPQTRDKKRLERVAREKEYVMKGATLTMAGYAELACFDSRAIFYATERLKECGLERLRDPFAFLVSRATQYSKTNNLPIDYSMPAKVRKSYGLNGTEERFEISKTTKQSAGGRKQQNPYEVVRVEHIPAEKVMENVKILEDDAGRLEIFKKYTGKDPREFFSNQALLGEAKEIKRNDEELQEKIRRMKYRGGAAQQTVSNAPECPKYTPGSNKIKEEECGNGSTAEGATNDVSVRFWKDSGGGVQHEIFPEGSNTRGVFE